MPVGGLDDQSGELGGAHAQQRAGVGAALEHREIGDSELPVDVVAPAAFTRPPAAPGWGRAGGQRELQPGQVERRHGISPVGSTPGTLPRRGAAVVTSGAREGYHARPAPRPPTYHQRGTRASHRAAPARAARLNEPRDGSCIDWRCRWPGARRGCVAARVSAALIPAVGSSSLAMPGSSGFYGLLDVRAGHLKQAYCVEKPYSQIGH